VLLTHSHGDTEGRDRNQRDIRWELAANSFRELAEGLSPELQSALQPLLEEIESLSEIRDQKWADQSQIFCSIFI